MVDKKYSNHETTNKKKTNKKNQKHKLYVFRICSDLPIRPPPTNDQVPCSWWISTCCDKSLLVGTYKHGCESYRQMRADPGLCYASHCGPGDVLADDISISKE